MPNTPVPDATPPAPGELRQLARDLRALADRLDTAATEGNKHDATAAARAERRLGILVLCSVGIGYAAILSYIIFGLGWTSDDWITFVEIPACTAALVSWIAWLAHRSG